MNYLKKIRKEKKMTLEDVSKEIGISKVFYWQIESEKRRLTYKMAVKIAEVFNTTPDNLFLEEFKTRNDL